VSESAAHGPEPVRDADRDVDQDVDQDADDVASASAATSSERAQAQVVHELSEPERLDGSQGPV
jgi:hypothetical protein